MLKTIVALLLALPMTANANQTIDLGSFAPKNNVRIPVFSENANPMTEELFDKILAHVKEIYTPMFTARGKTFVLQKDWNDPTANAYAQQRGNNWIIKSKIF